LSWLFVKWTLPKQKTAIHWTGGICSEYTLSEISLFSGRRYLIYFVKKSRVRVTIASIRRIGSPQNKVANGLEDIPVS
jgi:hypothetical protein